MQTIFFNLFIKLLLISILTDHLAYANTTPNVPKTFHEAKRLAWKIFQDHRETFYCGCPYDAAGYVHFSSCGFEPKDPDDPRAYRVEWEHIVPAKALGKHRPCWTQKHCRTAAGKPVKGRACCREIDPEFNLAESDLYNLQPAIGQINAARGTREFTVLSSEITHEYGACHIKLPKQHAQVEPAPQTRGLIARTYLYMAQTYHLPVNDKQLELFRQWDQDYPPTDWELERNRRIAAIQSRSE